MPQTQKDTLDKLRDAAQYFTMTAAVLSGLLWLGSGLIKGESLENNVISGIFAGATAGGGIVMGILYVVHLLRKHEAKAIL